MCDRVRGDGKLHGEGGGWEFTAILTIERRVHAADIDQEAHHGHAFGSVPITQQLVSQHLAGLAASRHGVYVEIGEALLSDRSVVRIGEDLFVIVKDSLEKVVLDILSPQRLAIILLQMSNLANLMRRIAAFGPSSSAPGWFILQLGGFVGHLGVVIIAGSTGSEGLAVMRGGRTGWFHVRRGGD